MVAVCLSFNSRLVRLVAGLPVTWDYGLRCFNSRLVRLVDVTELNIAVFVQFQFQIGAIGRLKWDADAGDGFQFQFQIGAIGSLEARLSSTHSISFQFQIGAIGRIIRSDNLYHYFSFQFQIGAIGRIKRMRVGKNI